MGGRILLVRIAASSILLASAMGMLASAAGPSIPDNSASDSAPNRLPGDASTPTAPADDIEDQRVTAQIRTALAGDKSLSALAQNVTIATNPQAVVLRGSVKPEEKDRVEALASQYAGTRQVINQLLVKDL
jgi:osmotically-inducible protein OsmY